MKAFYGSRISPNQTRTPEGFLICHNVPISRTGWQDYLGQELNLTDAYDKVIPVYRSPEEVFSTAAIASFEGKSVTDEHPRDDVRTDNYSAYEKGHVTNVRIGSGEELDHLVADLVIKDPVLISEIENGKREVSCGYNCIYEPLGDGKYQQVQIRGNHVAIVANGRAGDRVAIKDSKPQPNEQKKERSKPMKVDKNTLFGKMLSAFAKDAEPDELAEAAKMGPGKAEDMLPVTPPITDPKAADEGGNEAITALSAKIDGCIASVGQLAEIVKQLVESDKQVHTQIEQPKDALGELEAELGTNEPPNEESITVPAEQMNNDVVPVTSAENLPENPIPGADRNAILTAIRAVKPVIAAIPDAKERQKASDALAKSFRDQLKSTTEPQTNGYTAILAAQKANQKVKDAQPDESQFGQDWAKKFNPHYKEAK